MRYVYIIKNLINNKVYVGQSKHPFSRKTAHFYNARKGVERPLYYSMRKHGIENFVFEILEECADELINERERHWISHFDSFNPERGYNLTTGGEEGKIFSQESREKIKAKAKKRKHSKVTRSKISKANRERSWKNTTRQKISEATTGNRNGMYGRRGENCPNAKLTQMQADEIRFRLNANELVSDLAVEYGVSNLTIRRIKKNQAYIFDAHMPPVRVGFSA